MKPMNSLTIFMNMLKDQYHSRKPLQFLGLLVGDKQVGMAIAKVKSGPASPLCVMEREESTIMASKLQHLIKEQSVAGIIVGLPCHPRLEDQEVTKVEAFMNDLYKTRKLNSVPYTIWLDGNPLHQIEGVECLLDAFPFDPIAVKEIKDEAFAKTSASLLESYLYGVKPIGFYNGMGRLD